MSVRGSVSAAAAILCAAAASAQDTGPDPADAADRGAAATEAPDVGLGSSSADSGDALERMPVTRFETGISLEQKIEQQDYTAAVSLGSRLVRMTMEEFGQDSAETAEALRALARAQTRAGNYTDAEENYLRAVEILQDVEGNFTPSLIPVMTELGDSYASNEQFPNALAAYNEARTVSRRVYGLFNEGQIDQLDRISEAFVRMDEYAEADERQQTALELMLRNRQPHEPGALSARYKYAKWLRASRRFGEERRQYDMALQIIENHYGEDSVEKIRPLMETAASFRAQGVPVIQGYTGLSEALEILERQPDPDPLVHATLLRDLGDWRSALSRPDFGGDEYRRAWRILGETEDGQRLRDEWFSGIEFVYQEPMSQRGLSNDPDAADGFVLVRFDVEASGHASNARIVDSEPPGFKDDDVLSHLHTARFRPRVDEGEFVRADDLMLRFTFRYSADFEH